jgi:hypothetical protein
LVLLVRVTLHLNRLLVLVYNIEMFLLISELLEPSIVAAPELNVSISSSVTGILNVEALVLVTLRLDSLLSWVVVEDLLVGSGSITEDDISASFN